MFSDDELNDLLSRARAGDDDAIRDFLSRFEQEVTTMVRSRLPRKLRTQFDSTDFVQAVWKSLLVESGQDSPTSTMSNTFVISSSGWCATRSASSIVG